MSSQPPVQVTQAVENQEGFRSKAYWDPIGNCWTAGYGQTGPNVTSTTVVTRQQAVAALISDEDVIIKQLDASIAWASDISEPRYGSLVDAAYNLGVAGVLSFHEALGAMEKKDWKGSVLGFRNSKWYNEVPDRVNAICYMVYFNIWIEDYLSTEQTNQLNTAVA